MFEFSICLTGCEFLCRCRFPETWERLRCRMPASEQNWIGPLTQTAAGSEQKVDRVVMVREEDWNDFPSFGLDRSAAAEASYFAACVSDALLPFGRVLLHAAALRWDHGAYLICADPGVGKSTQARFLRELRSGEFGVICGDRPVVQFCHPERSEAESKDPFSAILVHPSPWNGKENWHGAAAAPLAGLILLERGPENRLTAIPAREAAIPMYQHLIQTGWDPANIRRAAALTTDLLRAAPIWKLTSFQVPDSTRLLLDAVFSPQAP